MGIKIKQSNFKFWFYTILILSLSIHVFSLILGQTSFSGWVWKHDPFHAVIEMSGSIVAFLVAYILIIQEKFKRGTSFNTWISGALIGMGLLDGVHALYHVGQHFVFFHSLATFWGGILFSTILLPSKVKEAISHYFIRFSWVSTVMMIIIFSMLDINHFKMVENGNFTPLAIFLNTTGGILLLISAFKILAIYRKTKKHEDVLFFLHCFLFGLAALTFQESKLWDFPWWSWHILRFLAYFTAFYYSFMVKQKIEASEEVHTTYELLNRTEEIANIGSWRLDLKTQELTWSDQTYRIHEVEVGDPVDVAEAINFYHPDYRDKITKYVEEGLANGTPWDDEFEFITAKGSHLWVRAIGYVVRNEDNIPLRIEGCFQDITEHKKSIMAKEEFLSVVSHEMRTPLTSILGMAEILNESKLDKEDSNYVDLIIKNSNVLKTIINDILDLSKFDKNTLHIHNQPVLIKSLFDDVSNVFKVSCEQKDIGFIYETNISSEIELICDSVRLRQICFNLLGNAVKFTQKGEVSFFVNLKEVNEKEVTLSLVVKDTGIGISSEFANRIFNPFEQDKESYKQYEGTGLGLSITKRIIDKLKGEIKFSSELGKGSSFSVEIPLLKVSSKDKILDTLKKETVDLSGVKILFADDTSANRIMVKGFLKKTGISLDLVEDGQQALDAFNRQEYDIVILDVLMPVMDGLTAAKEIRKIEKEKGKKPTPIIGFSAFAYKEDIDKALKAGCNTYLAKPAKKTEFIETIEQIIALKKD